MVREFPFKNLSKLELKDKKLLIPTMHPFGSKLLAACCRGFGIEATDIPTYINLNLGKQFTSGKECFPCQVTISDILTFLINEKNKLKDRFKPEDYVYLMPESDGPCRFGMYNKFHRIILAIEDYINMHFNNINFFSFIGGSCELCNPCEVVFGKECRFPYKARPSLEAAGINVINLLKELELPYKFSTNRVIWTGAILFTKK